MKWRIRIALSVGFGISDVTSMKDNSNTFADQLHQFEIFQDEIPAIFRIIESKHRTQ